MNHLSVEKAENKIRTIEDLGLLLEKLRAEGKKVAHCHGVFDLLHIGHIRHFQEARKMGDILAVTITPDQYVNKGPHRPAFPDMLRAEAIAALDSVDFVAVNKWPRATEAIRLLKPNFYVKGQDYKDASKDRTGGIVEEENAVREVGGELVFTEDITFSSSKLLNQYFNSFSEEANRFLLSFKEKFSTGDVIGAIDGLKPLKVLVVGEAIIDEYQYCDAIGKSSKEPMLAVKRLKTEHFLGGTLAVANHIANFCDHVSLLTFLGDKHTHEKLIREHMASNVHLDFLYRKDSPTIVKRRFIENYFFTKLMSVYDINDGLLAPQDEAALCERLDRMLSQHDLVLVVDYGHGMLTEKSIKILCGKSKYLAVNVQSNAGSIGYQSVAKYQKADYVCIAENEMRMEMRDRRGEIKSIVKSFAERNGFPNITVTRGKNGSLCYRKGKGFLETPAFAGKVVDRMGAGDAYIALTSVCLANGVPVEVSNLIGNIAGAQAVATVGHRQFIEKAPLLKHVESVLK